MNIAFIGLGNMGSPMAANLIKAGHTLTVYNRTRLRADELKPLGARVVATPGEAAAGAEIAITMLADDHALESVVLKKARACSIRFRPTPSISVISANQWSDVLRASAVKIPALS
jgi:3-hydroxyisobutyrate dehydrogenase-like beta-hydroxyacid dehydrogenase